MRRSPLYLAVILAVPFAVAAQTPTDQTQTTSTQTSTQPTTQATQTTQTTQATTQTTQDTTQAGDLGKHLQQVTPEHPLEHGRDFGECVSEIAMTGECPMM